ncbi:MAG TPA: TetR family transcriptional regulator [Acidisarcina sp.]
MSQKPSAETADPRVRRTHLLLGQALEKLLGEREFDKISVQDITEAATLNRATFYAHYPDKYSLLECMVASRFSALLEARGVKFDGGCQSALRSMALGVCDYLAAAPGRKSKQVTQMEPHMEAPVISVVTQMILAGMEKHPPANGVTASMLAAAVSWAMFGAAKDWVRHEHRCPSEEMADQIMSLLGPLLTAAYDGVAV